jgi:hypothetical protein
MKFVGHINIEYEEIEINNCNLLFNYVDYILHKNGTKNICHNMKVTFYKILTHINFHVVFYDNNNSNIASIQSMFLYGNEENYRYVLKYKNGQNYNTNYSKSQNMLKESILEKLNNIKDEIIKKNSK